MYSKISWGFAYIQPLVFFDNTLDNIPSGIYLLKVNERNARARCEICSKLTIKIPERCQWLNFEHVSHLALVFFFVNFEQVSAGWDIPLLTCSMRFRVDIIRIISELFLIITYLCVKNVKDF